MGARWTSSPASTIRLERPPDGLTVRSPLVFHREGDQSLYSEDEHGMDQGQDEFSKSVARMIKRKTWEPAGSTVRSPCGFRRENKGLK